jgi:hypothetical protein
LEVIVEQGAEVQRTVVGLAPPTVKYTDATISPRKKIREPFWQLCVSEHLCNYAERADDGAQFRARRRV